MLKTTSVGVSLNDLEYVIHRVYSSSPGINPCLGLQSRGHPRFQSGKYAKVALRLI